MKLKKLNKALVAAGLVAGAAVSMPSQAVVMSDDGTGEVLIYPFYTVQGPVEAPRASLFTIANTKDEYKAVKVRFHEAHNSRDALDFNLYLSPFDVWTGVVSRNAATGTAQLTTEDKSCTIPSQISTSVNSFSTLAYTQASNNDGGNQDALRTNEGYLEVIEMGVIDESALINASLTVGDGEVFNPTTGSIDSFGEAIKHENGLPGGSMGTSLPVGCVALEASFATGGAWDLADFDNSHAAITQPTGGLMGSAMIVQPALGTVSAYNATALKNFYDVAVESGTPGNADEFDDIHSFKDLNPAWANARSIQTYPNLAMAFPQDSVHFDADAGTVTTLSWATTAVGTAGAVEAKDNILDAAITDLAAGNANARPVSAVLAKESIINEYVLDQDAATGIDFRTDVVVTFPTKWYFTDNGLYVPGAVESERVTITEPATDSDVDGVELAPFSSQFVSEDSQGLACEQFSISSADPISGTLEGSIFDREEGTPTVAEAAGGLVPSPAINVEVPVNQNFFCHEANVMTINDGDLLSSRIANGLDATVATAAGAPNSFNVNFPEGFTSGWFELQFDTDTKHQMTSVDGSETVVKGLPAVGFVVEGLVSGATGFDGNFTVALPHKSR